MVSRTARIPQQNRRFTSASDTVVPLQAVAEAMIRFSDNAAADYLLDRVGPDGVDSFARRAGLAAQEPILPILGGLILLIWGAVFVFEWVLAYYAARLGHPVGLD